MGGKGRRRREKNYLAAHGGYTRLPPPPDSSQLDVLPFKLRQLISLTKSQDAAKDSKVVQSKKRKGDVAADLKSCSKDEAISKTDEIKGGSNDYEHLVTPQHADNPDDIKNDSKEKKKKKRKRKQVDDLRFEMEKSEGKGSSKKKERKKKYFEALKNKHKKGKTEENAGFPGREEIKFGDIVQAPPKLVAIPKAFKTNDASKERVRLQAIEAYRNRKGWTSRPGVYVPPPETAPVEL
ncbi:hypothetical protein UlMin_021601 [Ulmus minor]